MLDDGGGGGSKGLPPWLVFLVLAVGVWMPVVVCHVRMCRFKAFGNGTCGRLYGTQFFF